MIAKCECEHKGQDALNGPGMRVFNQGIKGHKCTCCCKIKDLGAVKKEVKTKAVPLAQESKKVEPKKVKK